MGLWTDGVIDRRDFEKTVPSPPHYKANKKGIGKNTRAFCLVTGSQFPLRVVNFYLLVGPRWGDTAGRTTVANFTKKTL